MTIACYESLRLEGKYRDQLRVTLVPWSADLTPEYRSGIKLAESIF